MKGGFLYRAIQKILPRISDSEMIALRSGTVSIDREIMSGVVSTFPKRTALNDKEANYIHQNVDRMIADVDGLPMADGPRLHPRVYKVIKDHRAFSYIIPEAYGGHGFSVEAQSRTLSKMSSANPAFGVTVMVPNSLSISELLLKDFGTSVQKEHYLPKLALGELIPCFGLTGPDNGSDALGSLDKAWFEGDRVVADISKRYITLSPVANCLGVAVNVEGHGPTLLICERDEIPVIRAHNPLNCGFPNGALHGRISIPRERIIGEVGGGWKALMECLASGRGVTLPASSLGPSIAAAYGVQGFAKLRQQFGIPLSRMQGVQEHLSAMMYHTILIDSGVRYMNAILDSGEKPAVLSAILKQQSTDRARQVVNCGMDVMAGSAIIVGPNNFLEKFYKSVPIGITVEGSNTLTRSLIIFGQGLNKSHPHISGIVETLTDPAKADEFGPRFRRMVGHSVGMFVRSTVGWTRPRFEDVGVCPWEDRWRMNIVTFANLCNIVALMGGSLKKEQVVSGLMADLFSQCYLSQAVLWDYETRDDRSKLEWMAWSNHRSKRLVLEQLHKEFADTLSEVKHHLPASQSLLAGISCRVTRGDSLTSDDMAYLATLMWDDTAVKRHFQEQIVVDGVLADITTGLETDNPTLRSEIRQKVVQVEEHNIL